MTEDEHLAAFGLRPRTEDLPVIRSLLAAETSQESTTQGEGDTEVMKLCCVQLFNSGELADSLLIWRAKEASFDAACSIDIQLLCGPGLDETKTYLTGQGSADAQAALRRLTECEAAGDFDDFSIAEYADGWSRYYALARVTSPSGRWSACPLRARSGGEPGSLRATRGLAVIPAELGPGR
jgi:hypothetical protein